MVVHLWPEFERTAILSGQRWRLRATMAVCGSCGSIETLSRAQKRVVKRFQCRPLALYAVRDHSITVSRDRTRLIAVQSVSAFDASPSQLPGTIIVPRSCALSNVDCGPKIFGVGCMQRAGVEGKKPSFPIDDNPGRLCWTLSRIKNIVNNGGWVLGRSESICHLLKVCKLHNHAFWLNDRWWWVIAKEKSYAITKKNSKPFQIITHRLYWIWSWDVVMSDGHFVPFAMRANRSDNEPIM